MSSRLILPEAGNLLVSNIFKPTGDWRVARIARKKLSGHTENNMAENSGKCFLAREISIFINLNRYFQLSVDCQNVKKVISNTLNELLCGYLEQLFRKLS